MQPIAIDTTGLVPEGEGQWRDQSTQDGLAVDFTNAPLAEPFRLEDLRTFPTTERGSRAVLLEPTSGRAVAAGEDIVRWWGPAQPLHRTATVGPTARSPATSARR